MSQDVVCAEVSLDSGQSVGQAGGLHLAAVVGAGRDVSVIHHAVIEGLVGDDQHMMGSQLCVPTVQTIVSMGGPVFSAVDGPVAAGADLLELASTNVSGLLSGEAGAEIVLIDEGVGPGRTGLAEHCGQLLQGFDVLGVGAYQAEDFVDGGDQAGLVLSLQRVQVSVDEGLDGADRDPLDACAVCESYQENVLPAGYGSQRVVLCEAFAVCYINLHNVPPYAVLYFQSPMIALPSSSRIGLPSSSTT